VIRIICIDVVLKELYHSLFNLIFYTKYSVFAKMHEHRNIVDVITTFKNMF